MEARGDDLKELMEAKKIKKIEEKPLMSFFYGGVHRFIYGLIDIMWPISQSHFHVYVH